MRLNEVRIVVPCPVHSLQKSRKRGYFYIRLNFQSFILAEIPKRTRRRESLIIQRFGRKAFNEGSNKDTGSFPNERKAASFDQGSIFRNLRHAYFQKHLECLIKPR